jgi:uncharacterized metal-binding protein
MSSGNIHHLWYKRIFFPIILPAIIITTLLSISLKINFVLIFLFGFIQYWLASFIGPDLDLPGLNDDDGRMMRFGKKTFPLFTIFGYITTAYWFFYAWLIGLVGGHRSIFSHGVLIGTIGRIIYFNIPIFLGLYFLYRYGMRNWNWSNPSYELYLDVWILPYILSQFIIWSLTDSLHILLDGRWAKGRLY